MIALAGCTSAYPRRGTDYEPRSPAGLTAAPDRSRTGAPPANDLARPPADAGTEQATPEQVMRTEAATPPPPPPPPPGQETHQSSPRSDGPARTVAPIDPGAAAVVDSIASIAGELRQGEDGVTRIGLTALRNQSRSTRDEFQAMRNALMEALTRAGRARRIVFTDAQEMAVQYYLEGAAYRLDDGQAGRWELFLHLRQEEDGLTIWEPPGPLRVAVEADGAVRVGAE